MRPENTVLFSDLDGTLFNSRGKVSPGDLAAIEAYKAAGGRFAIATGRQPDNAMTFLPGVITNAPSVVINGAAVYDFDTKEYSRCRTMDRALLDGVLELAMERIPELDLHVYVPEGLRYVTPRELAQPLLLALHQPCEFVPWASVKGADIFKCFFYVPPRRERELHRALEPLTDRGFRLLPGETEIGETVRFWELLSPGTHKGAALTALRDHPALAGRTFIAAGDYWNDVEMFAAADVSVAAANAPAEIRAMCRFVTADHDHDPIAHILREIVPGL